MEYKSLESSEYKNLYFHRTEQWDWHTSEMIRIIDSKKPRIITMDFWPQKIFLEALGQLTVADYIRVVAGEYPKGQVPEQLEEVILDMLEDLVYAENVVSFSDRPVTLDASLLNPMTAEGDIHLKGVWNGTYQYAIPDEFKDDKMIDVKFTITIDKVNGNTFTGTVQDDLSTGGTAGIGIIEGKFDNKTIRFTKNMPIRTRIINEALDRNINEDKKHPTLFYEGQFSRNKQAINGLWKFKKRVVFWKGFIPLYISVGHGTFTMSKNKL